MFEGLHMAIVRVPKNKRELRKSLGVPGSFPPWPIVYHARFESETINSVDREHVVVARDVIRSFGGCSRLAPHSQPMNRTSS